MPSVWSISESNNKRCFVFRTRNKYWGTTRIGFRPQLVSCYLLPLELIIKRLQMNYHFYVDDIVIYLVYEETVTQETFDLIISTLQKWFCGTQLKLNTSKREFIKVVRKNSFNTDLKLPMFSKFSNHVNFLGFILDDKLLFSARLARLLLPATIC